MGLYDDDGTNATQTEPQGDNRSLGKKAAAGKVDLARLCSAVRNARRTLEPFRVKRRKAVKEYVGANWSEGGADRRVPINLLALYVQVVGRNLLSKNPRVMLSTFDKPSKPAVKAMESWANREIGEMRLSDTAARVVYDALFSVGICKVALATPAESSAVGWNLPAGTPFAARVDLDDFVYDTNAKSFAEAAFVGHRYRVPLSSVKTDKAFTPKGRKKLQASDYSVHNSGGDERVATMGRGTAGDMEDLEDMVDLWEIYLPRTRQVITLADEDGSPAGDADDVPLRTQEWLGPDHGPYHYLSYGLVPGNAMPKAPVMNLIDLHEAVNRLLNKLIQQGDRQKEVLPVRGGATDDAGRLLQVNDGEAFKCDAPDLKSVSFGGPNAQNFALMTSLKDLFDFMAGNLSIMGGLAPQSKTASQDKMLNENSSAGVADMQDTTVTFMTSVIKALTWYWWHDPFKVMRTEYAPPGLPEYSIPRTVTPEQRQKSSWDDLDIKVDPYSMTHATPQSRAAGLNQIVQTVVVPMMPLLQQQGISFDLNVYLQKIAVYMDMPDLGDIITIQEPPPPADGGATGQPTMPTQTTRNYNRQSTSEATPKGQNTNMVNTLMAGGAQGGDVGGFAGGQ